MLYAFTVHCRVWTVPPSSRSIDGSAVTTTSASRVTMKYATAVAATVSPRRGLVVVGYVLIEASLVRPATSPGVPSQEQTPANGETGRTGTAQLPARPVSVRMDDQEATVRRWESVDVAQDLVGRARAGDAQAFEQLVDPHRRELQVHCYRILGSTQDAEDALQDTLLAAWQGLRGFEGRSSLRTWLYRIATSRCLNVLRSARRRPRTGWPPPGRAARADPAGRGALARALSGRAPRGSARHRARP